MVAAFIVPHQGVDTGKDGDGKGKGKGPDGGLSAREVREWVKERLSHHLVPKYVFWVDNYPKTASGKIQKFKLKELGLQMLGEGKGLE